MPSNTEKKQPWFLEFFKTVFWAVLIAVFFRSFLLEPFSIPSGSMIPTLKVGDYLFVSKYSYGYSRYSFPFAVVPFSDRVFASEPDRGDVIVFRRPGLESVDYIKRLVGLPGDTIAVKGGVLHINGKAVQRLEVGVRADDKLSRPARIYTETLPNNAENDGMDHLIQELSDRGPMDNTPLIVVPDGHYFFMGDNRDNSRDSRVFGFVPFENLIGRAEFIFFSHDGTAAFWEVWKWPFSIRFGRLGQAIE